LTGGRLKSAGQELLSNIRNVATTD